MSTQPATRGDVLIVVTALALFALGGLFGVIYLIQSKAETGAIAIVSGLVGTALGSLSSMLVSTSKQAPPGTPDSPIATTNVNGANDPVLTQQTPTAPNPSPESTGTDTAKP